MFDTPPQQIACHLRAQGATLHQISTSLQCPYATVQRWVKEVRPPEAHLLTVYRDGLSVFNSPLFAALPCRAGDGVDLVPPPRGLAGTWYLDLRPTASRKLNVTQTGTARFRAAFGRALSPRFRRPSIVLTLITLEPEVPSYYPLELLP